MGRGLRIGAGSPGAYILSAEYGQYNLAGQSATLSYVSSAGPTYYASTTGSTNPAHGSLENPWTLKYALTQLVAGDTLRVLDGDYSDTEDYGSQSWAQAFNPTNSGTAGNPITIISHNLHGATLHKTVKGADHCPAIGILERDYITVSGFRIDGTAKARGIDGSTGGPNMKKGVIFENLEIIGGDYEGDDTSLTWGAVFQWMQFSTMRGCYAHSMRDAVTGDNTSCFENFNGTDNVFEFNEAEVTGVYAGFAQKAGDCHRNVFRYNVVYGFNTGDSGETGCAFYNKADTAASKFADDNEYYGNVVYNGIIAFKQNHNCRRTKIYNNTAYDVDYLYSQFQNNNIDAQIYNNICYGDGSTRAYFLEAASGATPDLSVYVDKANHNVFFNMGATDHCYWGFGSNSISLASFRTSAQTVSMTGRDVDSITTNPSFVNAAAFDFHLDGGPAIGTGEGGVNRGAYFDGNEAGPEWR